MEKGKTRIYVVMLDGNGRYPYEFSWGCVYVCVCMCMYNMHILALSAERA